MNLNQDDCVSYDDVLKDAAESAKTTLAKHVEVGVRHAQANAASQRLSLIPSARTRGMTNKDKSAANEERSAVGGFSGRRQHFRQW